MDDIFMAFFFSSSILSCQMALAIGAQSFYGSLHKLSSKLIKEK